MENDSVHDRLLLSHQSIGFSLDTKLETFESIQVQFLAELATLLDITPEDIQIISLKNSIQK